VKEYLLIAAAVVSSLIIFSPVYEEVTDAVVGDAAITKTCWDRHGYNFVSRWSCRATFHQVGFIGLGLTCAFNKEKKSDICENLNTISAENAARKATVATKAD
jgi:hypothetical protein